MIEKNDWRLMGQEGYLKGVTLKYDQYRQYSEDWDHDHCEFCGEKFTFDENPENLHEGYSTLDEYTWICNNCFDDFRLMFEWKVSTQ
ncbi:MAG: hypothetical protein JNL95_03955 [Chitinophagales bacterium]|nr:hypothetical protein [Chitinophagales bacterium]